MKVIDKYNNISINRGDVLPLTLSIKDEDGEIYTFKEGDIITFGVYEAKKMNENALLLKQYEIHEEATEFGFTISSEEMKFGELTNKPKDYWYEIQLNNVQTIIGYDENGAKLLTLYPEGSDVI